MSGLTIGVGTTVDYSIVNQVGTVVPDCALMWSTSNSKVVTVGPTGLATGKAVGGPITISAKTVTRPQLSVSALISVAATVASVTVSPIQSSIAPGTSLQLSATVKDAAGNTLAGRMITWTSAAPAVVTIDASGLATAMASGVAAITATVEEKSSTATITVPPSTTEWTVVSGGNGHLYQFIPGNIPWLDAASAGATRFLGGLKGHLATITSSAENNFVTSFVLAQYTGNLSSFGVHVGGYQDRSAAAYSEPRGGWRWVTKEPFSFEFWRSGEPSNNQGIEDYLMLWASSPAGTWNDIPSTPTPFEIVGYVVEYGTVDAVVISTTPTTMRVGGTQQLSAQALDIGGAAISGRTITWTSSDPAVATVSASGLVTAKGVGSVSITAAAETQSASVSVVVSP